MIPTPRAPRPTTELEVLSTQLLNPHLVRVRLGGEGFSGFEDRPETDKYVKLKFTTPAPESHPVTRTYTVRRVDPDSRTLDIDFVLHGADGLAGPWAASTRPGDRIKLVGPGGGYLPDAQAGWYLFAGDLSAVPAIAAALEALPLDAVGVAFIEVETEETRLDLAAPTGVNVNWIVNPTPDPNLLADRVRNYTWPNGAVQVFAHGERESMKALRRMLISEKEVARAQLSLSGYWAHGRSEDRFQAEKREPIGQIFPES